MIYLDNAATTPLDPEVLETMIEYMRNEYGNPSSKYYPQAISAQKSLEHARTQVAELLGTRPEFIIFTSGSTESNNFVLKGVAEKYCKKGKHIITSKTEHKSVLETCHYLAKKGYEITYLDVDQSGKVSPSALLETIRKDTILVSIMWANNEIGTLNPISEIARVCSSNNVLFHVDATQAVGKVDINLSQMKIDFLSLASHKLHGPKGIGAVYVGPDQLGIRHKIPSLIHGGSQEFKYRAGTQAMHDIVGFGKACEVAKRDLNENIKHLSVLESQIKAELLSANPKIRFNGDPTQKIPGIISISIPGINNELFCKQVAPIAAISTGSACTINEGSYVLEAIGAIQTETVRLSVSRESKLEDLKSLIVATKVATV